jgi:hypothetical protein
MPTVKEAAVPAPNRVGGVVPTNRAPIAYLTPALIATGVANVFVYLVFAATHMVASFTGEDTKVKDPSAAAVNRATLERVTVAPAVVPVTVLIETALALLSAVK